MSRTLRDKRAVSGFGETVLQAGPQGELLTVFPNDEEEVRVIEIDKTRGENVRRWWPFFRDRRIDAFGGLTERFLV